MLYFSLHRIAVIAALVGFAAVGSGLAWGERSQGGSTTSADERMEYPALDRLIARHAETARKSGR